MLKLMEKVKYRMEAGEAMDAMNELMGGANHGKSMRECLGALLNYAGVSHDLTKVYRVRESRVGRRVCYVFAFLCNGRRYEGFVDKLTGEILRYGFQPA